MKHWSVGISRGDRMYILYHPSSSILRHVVQSPCDPAHPVPFFRHPSQKLSVRIESPEQRMRAIQKLVRFFSSCSIPFLAHIGASSGLVWCRSIYNSVSSVVKTRDIASAEDNRAPVDVEIGNGETPAPVQTAPPNVLEQARLGNLDLFRAELESGNHPLDFKAGPGLFFNRTPLHLAAMEGHEEIVGVILSRPEISRGVVNAKDGFGYTPLHLAVRHSHENIVRLLTTSSWVLPDTFLAATSEPDDVGAYYGGCTPLHLAAVRGDTAIARLLLRQPRQLEFAYAPVNIHAINWNSETPLDLARQNAFEHLVGFLEISDLNYLQQERARCAMSANAILVGAALVAAAAYGAWLQPPGGIPNPDSEAPSPSPSASTSSSSRETVWSNLFFRYAEFAFLCSVVALVLGTLATFPFPAASLKVEVKLLRRVVRNAQIFLVMALIFLMYSFSFAASIVLHKFAAIYRTGAYYIITWLPLITHLFVLQYFYSLDSLMRKRIKKRLIISLLLLSPAYYFFNAH